MTCIVGLIDKGAVYMGADSCGADNDFAYQIRVDAKLFQRGPFLIGYTTSFRMGQLLRWKLPHIKIPEKMDVHEFMCTKFIDSVRTTLNKGGFSKRVEEREEAGQFIVGFQNRLFEVGSDYQVGECVRGYAACGTGRDLALGSLWTTGSPEYLVGIKPPMERLKLALSAAEAGNAAVRSPFLILKAK
jgi:hypothetical protein